jgi:hypothetical protein
LTAEAQPSRHVGTVRSPSGAYLGNVWVQKLGERRGVWTAPDGQFQFRAGTGDVFLFAKDGFRPLLWTTSGFEGRREVSVTLEPETKVALSLGSCRRQGPNPIRELQIASARGVRVTPGWGVDYKDYEATYESGGRVESLSSMTGLHAGGGPSPEWVKGLSSFHLQSVGCGGFQWFDLRGSSAGGLASRWVAYSFGFVEYSKVSIEAAHVFDKAIDLGCCR